MSEAGSEIKAEPVSLHQALSVHADLAIHGLAGLCGPDPEIRMAALGAFLYFLSRNISPERKKTAANLFRIVAVQIEEEHAAASGKT